MAANGSAPLPWPPAAGPPKRSSTTAEDLRGGGTGTPVVFTWVAMSSWYTGGLDSPLDWRAGWLPCCDWRANCCAWLICCCAAAEELAQPPVLMYSSITFWNSGGGGSKGRGTRVISAASCSWLRRLLSAALRSCTWRTARRYMSSAAVASAGGMSKNLSTRLSRASDTARNSRRTSRTQSTAAAAVTACSRGTLGRVSIRRRSSTCSLGRPTSSWGAFQLRAALGVLVGSAWGSHPVSEKTLHLSSR